MHEVSLVAELVEECERRAGAVPVSVVRLRHATTIDEDILRQAFVMLTETGPLAGATLEVEPYDIFLTCRCGFDDRLSHDDLMGGMAICPSCGAVSALERRGELELLEVRTA